MATGHLVTRRQPIQWSSRKPREVGVHTGKIYGHEFMVEIFTDRLHSQRTTWSYDFEFLGDQWSNEGQSGGVQRALSCLRDDLETICKDRGIE